MATNRRFFKELRFRQLRALVELSRRKTFAAVARELGLSVPSAWLQVRSLEEEFGVSLVVVKGQQVELTEDGRILLEMAEPLVEGFTSLRAVFKDRRSKAARTLTVVAPAGILSGVVADFVQRYREQFPKVRMTLIDRPSKGARAVLEAGGADLAIVGLSIDDKIPASLTTQPLTQYPIKLLCPEDHPLAKARRLTLKQIAQHPLVLASEETSARHVVDLVFAREGLLETLNVSMSASQVPLIINYVAIGFGVALIAPFSLELPPTVKGQPKLILRDVSNLFGHEHVVIMQRKGRYQLPHVKAFCELVGFGFKASKAARSSMHG